MLKMDHIDDCFIDELLYDIKLKLILNVAFSAFIFLMSTVAMSMVLLCGSLHIKREF